jgi:alcohol dehydrogenase, propanol-preferring
MVRQIDLICLVYDGPAEKHGEWVRGKVGGVQAAIVTVPLVLAFDQAFDSVKRCGRVVAVGMPKGNMSVPIARLVTTGIELIGATLGTRQDLQEALDLAKLHRITCKVEKRPLKDINQIFDDMAKYKISGRIVIDFKDS